MNKDIDKLFLGFNRFHKEYFEDNPKLYDELSHLGQSPKSMFVACCDSRVHPDKVFDTQPGEIFVVRNVANLVPAYVDDGKTHGTSAALEFAVKALEVEHVIVFGHSQCGGIKSLMSGAHQENNNQFIDPWMQSSIKARDKVLCDHADKSFEQQCIHCEKESILNSINNLLSFPFVKDKVNNQKLQLHGWYFDIEAGDVQRLHDD